MLHNMAAPTGATADHTFWSPVHDSFTERSLNSTVNDVDSAEMLDKEMLDNNIEWTLAFWTHPPPNLTANSNGMPAPLNYNILCASVTPAPAEADMPYTNAPPVEEATRCPRPLPPEYRETRYCIKCGGRPKLHKQEYIRFGAECTREFCDICGMCKVSHEEEGTSMGYWCTLVSIFDAIDDARKAAARNSTFNN